MAMSESMEWSWEAWSWRRTTRSNKWMRVATLAGVDEKTIEK